MSVDLSGQRLGHYLVREVIGRGGMSVVYRAVDSRLDRPVALKVMSQDLSTDPEFRRMFAEEARAASAIDHVNVVPMYDFGEEQGWLYIAMRLVDGTDLARELAGGPLPVRRVMHLLGQVGAALDMLHERGLVHLDVKPANVLITRNESAGTEHVYLADFGLTRRGTTGHQTAGGDFLGSPSYASPEHLRGEEILPSSDEYSLTCMLFTALAGRAPFLGDVQAVIAGHLSGQVPSLAALAGLPAPIDRVIARGLAHDPAARYPTSADLLAAARKALSQISDSPENLQQGMQGAPYGASSATFDVPASAESSRDQPRLGAPVNAPTNAPIAPQLLPQPPPLGQGAGWWHTEQARTNGADGPGTQGVWGPSGPAPVGPAPKGWIDWTAGHGPTSHRVPSKKGMRKVWPWVAGAAGVVLVGVAVVVMVTKSSDSSGPGVVAPPAVTGSSVSQVSPSVTTVSSTTGSLTTGPTATTARLTAAPTTSLLVPNQVLSTGLSSVSGLPDPFATSK